TGTKDADNTGPVSESDGQNAFAEPPKAEVSRFLSTVGLILGNDPLRIGERILRQRERHSVLGQVFLVLALVPFEAWLRHAQSLSQVWFSRHTIIWPLRCLLRRPSTMVSALRPLLMSTLTAVATVNRPAIADKLVAAWPASLKLPSGCAT